MNKFKVLTCIAGLLILTHAALLGQQKDLTFTASKGQMVDYFFLKTQPDIDRKKLFAAYRAKLYSTGKDYSFLPDRTRSIRVKKTLQGSRHFDVLVFGLWRQPSRRVAFIDDIVEKVPEFHELRKEIWQSFDLTYFEAKEDISLTLQTDRYHVATAYWAKTADSCSDYITRWKKEVTNNGGKIVFAPSAGDSPYGYYYNPDYFFITEWSSSINYNQFIEKMKSTDPSCMANINEFEL